jgi:dienelactone hydrolase
VPGAARVGAGDFRLYARPGARLALGVSNVTPRLTGRWRCERPVVGSFGGADRSPLGAPAGRRLGELLTEFAVPHDVKIYPGVGHGFMDDHAPEDQTMFLRFLARISGTRYDEDATVDARRRIVEFFNTHLRPDAPSST